MVGVGGAKLPGPLLFFTMFIKLHIPEHSLGDPFVPEYQVWVAHHSLLVHGGDRIVQEAVEVLSLQELFLPHEPLE